MVQFGRIVACNLFAILMCIEFMCLTQVTFGQILDGDEQFEAHHQDIGRISGLNNGARVAAQSTLVSRQPEPADFASAPVEATYSPAPTQTPIVTPPHRQAARSSAGHANHDQRKPNRITLVPKRDSQTFASLQVAASPPAPITHNIQAPATFQQQHFNDQPFTPSFAPRQPAEPQASGSFGSNNNPLAPPAGQDRHSLLMAQVAAEREGAQRPTSSARDFSAFQDEQPQPVVQRQPSLGSPLEALSSPSMTQVQAPPASSQPQPQPQATFQQRPALVAAARSGGTVGPAFVNQPEEPIVAPSFDHVLSNGCPQLGVFSYENRDHCDKYYLCTNGTFTEETCPNGLAYGTQGAVYQFCAYNWNVDCGNKKTSSPVASPGCPWQFGIFPIEQNGRCSIDYFACEWGVPETKRCTPEGLFYDDRIKGCQWADQLGCKSEGLLNFKCPAEDEGNPYWPYPRYYHNAQDIIVCVNEQPRLVHCSEDQLVEPSSLACVDIRKKKKKF